MGKSQSHEDSGYVDDSSSELPVDDGCPKPKGPVERKSDAPGESLSEGSPKNLEDKMVPESGESIQGSNTNGNEALTMLMKNLFSQLSEKIDSDRIDRKEDSKILKERVDELTQDQKLLRSVIEDQERRLKMMESINSGARTATEDERDSKTPNPNAATSQSNKATTEAPPESKSHGDSAESSGNGAKPTKNNETKNETPSDIQPGTATPVQHASSSSSFPLPSLPTESAGAPGNSVVPFKNAPGMNSASTVVATKLEDETSLVVKPKLEVVNRITKIESAPVINNTYINNQRYITNNTYVAPSPTYCVEQPRCLESSSTVSPYSYETTTKKHQAFISEPLRNKSVYEVPGIGKALGQRLESQGMGKASSISAAYRRYPDKPDKFENYMKNKCGANKRQARAAYKAMEDYYDS